MAPHWQIQVWPQSSNTRMVGVRSWTATHGIADRGALVAELAAGCGLAGALQARGLGGHRRIAVVQAQRVAQGRRRRCSNAAARRAQRRPGDGEPQARRAGGDARHGAARRRARRRASRWRRSAFGADLCDSRG